MNNITTEVQPGAEPVIAPRGLKGVVVTDTTIGDVRGHEGFFHYRDHATPRLARQHCIEEVWHLLTRGHLPDGCELATFRTEIAAARSLHPAVEATTRAAAALDPTPMELLRTALSAAALGAPWLDLSIEEQHQEAHRLIAMMPSLAALAWHAIEGDPLPDIEDQASVAHGYLQQVTGSTPSAHHVQALERYIVLTIDHGLNASTFTGRTVVSTGASFGSAAVAAIGSLSGPLHGGAPSLVRDMLLEIGSADRAREWIRDHVAGGNKLMGFGHAVYRTADPRSELLKETSLELGGPLADLALAVEPIALEEMERHRPGADLRTNVEFYAAVVLDAVGLPAEMFTPTFAVSRMMGWMTHALEQAADNKIFRPSSRYIGPEPH